MGRKSIPKFLFDTLRVKRGSSTRGEEYYVDNYLIPNLFRVLQRVPDHEFTQDNYGNLHVTIGPEAVYSKICFTAHTDTVERKESGINILEIQRNRTTIKVSGGGILGADDGAGLFVLFEMIRHGVWGSYKFFRDEEWGGLGSKYYTENYPEEALEYDLVVSFDRKGMSDIIKYQMMEQCASDLLVEQLYEKLEMKGTSDCQGSFTDSANFSDLTEDKNAECTNVSVGYFKEHTRKESLNYGYLKDLARKCCKLDWMGLDLSGEFDEEDELGESWYYDKYRKISYKLTRQEEEDEWWHDYWMRTGTDPDDVIDIVDALEDNSFNVRDNLSTEELEEITD